MIYDKYDVKGRGRGRKGLKMIDWVRRELTEKQILAIEMKWKKEQKKK